MITLTKTTTYAALMLTTFTLAGCMVGPQYHQPQTIAASADSYIYDRHYLTDFNDPNIGAWWKNFGDPVTEKLVNLALTNNYDLQAAAARVEQSHALLEQASGALWPSVDLNFNRRRAKSSLNFGGGRFSSLTTTFNQDISITYIADLFGKLRHAQRAAQAELLASTANRKAVIHAVISSTVQARTQIATLQRALEIARQSTKNWQTSLEIVERRYTRGLTDPVDVWLARENLSATKASETSAQQALILAQNALDVLIAAQPGSTEPLPETLPDLPDLPTVPVGIPAALLDRRPDVQAAELALKAANERIGVSIAQLYPDLTLTGTFGNSADVFDDLYLDETQTYSAVINILQPLFRGGQLKARVKQQRAVYEELAANYAKTVITAVREVEDAMVTEQILQQRLTHVRNRYQQAFAAEKLARERYSRGVESLITVLEAERRRRIAENQLNLVKGQIWSARVQLYLALGGDWIHTPPNAKSENENDQTLENMDTYVGNYNGKQTRKQSR